MSLVTKLEDFKTLLAHLDTFLYQSRALWQLSAFNCDALPWSDTFPTLAKKVWQLDDAALDAVDKSPERLLSTLLPALEHDCLQADAQWDLALLSSMLIPLALSSKEDKLLLSAVDEPHFSAHIKGRKWQQITAFTQALPDSLFYPALPVIEWCAGKGHLGRLIAQTKNVSVTSLEWQAELCEAGEAFAQKWALPQHFICTDAFKESGQYIAQKQSAVALHACGDLHVRLLHLATQAQTQQIAISPCCYHLIQESHYQALSSQGKVSQLNLSRQDLQLPLQQSVIANDKQNTYRLKEVAWRLGFDTLQRQVRKVNTYLPVPSMKQSQLNGPFKDFCLWAAQNKRFEIPNDIDFDVILAKGVERQRLTRRIDLVAHLFRGLLERWLLLDRVCFLQEAGYTVSLSRFCEPQVTPRNALILAYRQD
ncbi:methyltransferase [Shewanella surugensis]|uniref:SAM-dependent methyltransferase n=1 Tax=Shewanella surugensis TaxID=212020 RepID=A0ABT0L8A3_9GAMM|nr:methyltransferase [Shewanella surugensis]MCL1123720.1 SAM-dependent methyltransferase [Shewanella surugensis]